MNKSEMPLKRNGLERMFGHLMAMEVRRIFDLSISMCVFKLIYWIDVCCNVSQGEEVVPCVCGDSPAAWIRGRHFHRRRKCTPGYYAFQLQVVAESVAVHVSLSKKRVALVRH